MWCGVVELGWATAEHTAVLRHCYVGFEKAADRACALESLQAAQARTGRKSGCNAVAVGERHLKLRYDEPKSKNTFKKFIADHFFGFDCVPLTKAEMKDSWRQGSARTQDFLLCVLLLLCCVQDRISTRLGQEESEAGSDLGSGKKKFLYR